MSKSYQRKKIYRLSLKKMAKDRFINDASGKMVPRNGTSSMYRDYYPQR